MSKKTTNISIGVPLPVFANCTLPEIKERLIDGLDSYCKTKTLKEAHDKNVRMTVRIDKDVANKIRAIADFRDMTIVDFTSKLF